MISVMKKVIAKSVKRTSLQMVTGAAAKKPKKILKKQRTAIYSAVINVIRMADAKNVLTSVSCKIRPKDCVPVSQYY